MAYDINQDGKIDENDLVYDVGGDNSPGSYVDFDDDLSTKTKKTLADYLSQLTKGKLSKEQANEYPVGDTYREWTLLTESGNPVSLNYDTNSSGGGEQFLSKNETLALSTPPTIPAPGTNDVLLTKGKTDTQSRYDGNTLLRSVTPEKNDVDQYYTSPALKVNRFTSDNPISRNLGFAAVTDTSITNQKTLGVYDPNAKQIGFDVLQKVGKLMSLRSSGEAFAFNDGFDPDSSDALSVLLPGATQSGVAKVNTQDFTADDILSALIGEQFGAEFNENSTDSYGNVNNYLEPFAGMLPLGTMALAIVLILALELSLTVIIEILAFITGTGTSNSRKKDQATGKYFLGNSSYDATYDGSISFPPIPLPPKLFGLNEIQHPLDDAVEEGLAVFFGADADAGVLSTVASAAGGAFKAAFEAPGFYATLVKNIVRSAVDIGRSIGESFGDISNPMNAIEAVVGIIEIVRSSKVIGAINVFAQIGDNSLRLKELEAAVNASGFSSLIVKAPGAGEKVSLTDSLPDTVQAVSKNRLGTTLKLAWSANRTPSVLMLPRNIHGAALTFGASMGGTDLTSLSSIHPGAAGSLTSIDTTSGRIPAEVVQDIEAQLDGEYVPFYFHDLRTNEILSFHAFITALSDEFSVNWENTEAYGRVDPVKTYKGTNRRISLGFVIAATSPQDFDEMWVKINKLVTMVYPQWSLGSKLTLESSDSFIQPFSQLQSASPIVRLRLGDLLRSNFSRFNLGRLFGLGTDNLKINASYITENQFNAVVDKVIAELTKVDGVQVGYKYFLVPGDYPPPTTLPGAVTIGSPKIVPGLKSNDYTAVEVVVVAGSTVVVKVDTGFYSLYGLTPPLDDTTAQFAAVDTDLILREDFIAEIAKQVIDGDSDAATVETIAKFLGDDNVIVRSFKSVAGKGLACAIDSLSFDWYDNITWETSAYGSRAPKMCRVNLSISPIHDIAPGLDHTGFNRAPVYNVGRVMNGIGGDSWDESNKGKIQFYNKSQIISKLLNRTVA